jgi:hypothetical protein
MSGAGIAQGRLKEVSKVHGYEMLENEVTESFNAQKYFNSGCIV